MHWKGFGFHHFEIGCLHWEKGVFDLETLVSRKWGLGAGESQLKMSLWITFMSRLRQGRTQSHFDMVASVRLRLLHMWLGKRLDLEDRGKTVTLKIGHK